MIKCDLINFSIYIEIMIFILFLLIVIIVSNSLFNNYSKYKRNLIYTTAFFRPQYAEQIDLLLNTLLVLALMN